MKAYELPAGCLFRVVGLGDRWEVLNVSDASVLVRRFLSESRTFTTADGDEVTIVFKPRPFNISRETSVEVDS